MLYQPTNVYPSMTGGLGNGVVDVTKPLKVSWQVNGNSAMTAYQITIYKNDSASTQVMTTSTLTNNCPFYGVDYSGNIQFFSHTISAATMASAGMTNGNEYTIKIRQWWGTSDTDSVTQTSANAFITRATPTVTLASLPTAFSYRSYTFSATYAQAQGDVLNWVQWELALVAPDGEYTILKDSGKIYGTAELKFDYDGFFSGSSYAVRCTIQTQNGVDATTGWNPFSVSYETVPLAGTLTASPLRKANGISLTFPAITSIPATITGSYTMENSKLSLPSGSTAVWDSVNGEQMSFKAPFNVLWQAEMELHSEMEYLTIEGTTESGVEKSYTLYSVPHFEITDNVPTLEYAANSMASDFVNVAGAGIVRVTVCVGSGNTAKVYSTAYGDDWFDVSLPVSAVWTSVCYGNARFVAVGNSGYGVYSDNGVSWVRFSLPNDRNWTSVAYGNGVYAAVADQSNVVAYSKDGISWTETTMAYSVQSVTNPTICYGDGRFMILTQNLAYSLSFEVSTNGMISFGQYTLPAVRNWTSVCYGNERFVAVAENSSSGAYLDTGQETWQTMNMPRANVWTSVCYGNRFFFATCTNSTSGAYSVDGVEWRSVNGSCNSYTKSACYFGYDSNTVYFLNAKGELGFTVWIVFGATVVHKLRYAINKIKMILTENGNISLEITSNYNIRESVVRNTGNGLSNINKISLFGQQECDYLFISSVALSESEKTTFWNGSLDFSTIPSYFYTDFDDSTNGGGIGSTKISSLSIYRRTPGEAVLTHISDTTPDTGNAMIDCSAIPGKCYTYYAYGTGQQSTSALTSEAVTLCAWDWALFSCTQDAGGVYHPQEIFLFSNNVSSGSVSNNNSPGIMQNFTRYPTVQPAPQNYRSGTLTSLIGAVTNGVYSDTIELRNAIAGLSTAARTLFLKNRKGDIMKVTLSGPVEMATMDETAAQAQTVTLPWAEIGSAENASIILTKNDAAWPY